MMRVRRVLHGEHRLIRRAAACLDRLADDALESNDLCVLSAIELLEFFEDFVDGAHQEKEERCLFPALLDSGLARHRVQELLDDHADERESLSSMREKLERAAHGDGPSREEFATTAMNYAMMQIEHADDEERFLVPLVEELLDRDAERYVLQGFRAIDADLPKPREHYFALVNGVARRMATTFPQRSVYDG